MKRIRVQTYILSYSEMKVRKAVDEGKTIQKLPRCLCVCVGKCVFVKEEELGEKKSCKTWST